MIDSEELKTTILKRGIKAIPNFVWVFCASYALIMLTNVFVIKFTDIDIDKHINKYFEIKLAEMESKKECKIDLGYQKRTNDRLNLLEQYSHRPSNK